MLEKVTIILPLPPACLSPNWPQASRGGRMKRMREAKRYRLRARDAISAAQVESAPWQLASIRAAFYHKTTRRRDDVNHLAMLKSAYDGIVEAGLLVDDDSQHLKTQTPTFAVDRECPRVELTLEKLP